MDTDSKKPVFKSFRIRRTDKELLEALSTRMGWNLSDTLRRSIVDEAEKNGLKCIDGLIVEEERIAERGQ